MLSRGDSQPDLREQAQCIFANLIDLANTLFRSALLGQFPVLQNDPETERHQHQTGNDHGSQKQTDAAVMAQFPLFYAPGGRAVVKEMSRGTGE
jgi:hypothetical protein